MRALLPERVDVVDVHAHYALDWVDHGGVRANMVASADGAAAADGVSRGLQTPGDNRVFAALRDLADVVLVGAVTAQAEGYRPARFDQARGAVRRQYGFGPALPVALVSRTLRLDLAGALFTDPAQRPLVVTCAAAAPSADLSRAADVIVCGDEHIDFGEARRQLAARGLTRVLCEGGPTLLAQLIDDGELDELCLSITPLLMGPAAGRIVAGQPRPAVPRGVDVHGLLEEDGALFVRYCARR
jgi:riboflavin biosynthesis pyrimidine reductase